MNNTLSMYNAPTIRLSIYPIFGFNCCSPIYSNTANSNAHGINSKRYLEGNQIRTSPLRGYSGWICYQTMHGIIIHMFSIKGNRSYNTIRNTLNSNLTSNTAAGLCFPPAICRIPEWPSILLPPYVTEFGVIGKVRNRHARQVATDQLLPKL